MNKKAMLLTASTLALLAPLPAGAVTLDWISASGAGTITAAPGGGHFTTSSGAKYTANDHATAVSGSFLSSPVTLLPADTFPAAPSTEANDNLVYVPPSGAMAGLYLDYGGVSFSFNSGKSYANLFGYTSCGLCGPGRTTGYRIIYGPKGSSPTADFLAGRDIFATVNGVNSVAGVRATPLPAALPLFAGGVAVVGLMARRKTKKKKATAAARA